ncbi:MAG: LPS export ABC transporter periplasmic protein LptC [Rhodobacteraceae bacterium]|nr:LPS export ABC transporter periplasmic protein LptC [Paracoccaceae bacterium]
MPTLKISYSNTVFYLKLTLVFLGLFALVMIFLSAKKLDPSTEIPFAKDIDFATLDDGLTKPIYSSMTNSGDEVRISAEQIISTEKKDIALIKSAILRIFSVSGSDLFLSSDTALLDKGKKNLIFSKNVILQTNDKIEITAPKIFTALDKTLIQADGPIKGIFGNSNIEAGKLDIIKENASSNLVISFTKGVKMVYNPGKSF